MIKKLLKSKKALLEEFIQELYQIPIDEEKLQFLLNLNKFEINYQDNKGNSFLHKCIENKKLKSVYWLIKNGGDIQLKNNYQITPLSLLIENQYVSLLQLVLDKKLIDIHQKDEFGRTLLQNAVVLGYLEVAKLFIDYGIDINSRDKNNRNVLYDALSFGNEDFIKFLLTFKELDINLVDKNNDSILHHPQARKEDNHAINLIKAGADATIKNKNGETFLCNTALRGVSGGDVLKAALEEGNDINSRVKNNNSILMELVAAASKLSDQELERRNSLLKISKTLIDRGIDVNALDDNNETALFRAVRQNDKEQVNFLLSAGIDANVVNSQYETVLTIAILQGVDSLDIILLLIHNGADPSIKNHKKQSIFEILNGLVLHTHNKKLIKDQSLADKVNINGQYLLVLKELLTYNKDPLEFYDSKGDPLFFEPLLEDHFPMFKLYITNGMNIQKRNLEGFNLFYKYVHKVFEDNDPNVDFQNNLSILISKKVDQHSQDHTGYTVLHKIMHTNCNLHLFDTLTDIVQFDYQIGDKLGRSVIHAGVWNNQKMVMKRIHNIDSRAINKPDIYGILPITYAALLGNQDLVLMFLDLKSNIKSNVKIEPKAVKKFSPMLKNLTKLKLGLDPIQLSPIETLIEQVKIDFSDHEQRIFN